MANPWDNDPIVKAAPSQSGGGMPWDSDPIVRAAKPSAVEDVAKSAGSGLVRGATSVAGFVGDMASGLGTVADTATPYVASGINRMFGTKLDEGPVPKLRNPVAEAIGSESINRAIDTATGAPVTSYKPQTVAGEYARTIGEFAPGIVTPGGPVAKVVGGVLAPAIASETAGQAARHIAPELEAPARLVGAVGAGLGAAALTRPQSATAAAARHMSNVTDADVLAAGRLMEEAASRSVPITWPEALAQTTGNAASLTSLQRVVEGSERGGEVMRGFMSQRPAQMQAAGRAALDDVAAPVVNPSTVGPQAGRAAQSVIDEGRGVINNATRPLYQAAEAQRLDPADFARINQIPAFQQELKALRADPIMGPQFAQHADDSVAVIDAIQKRVRDLADEAKGASQNFRADIIGGQRKDIVSAADAAAPTYAQARQTQADFRERYLQPIIDGPLGKIAAKDTTTETAIQALFPRKPLPGSAGEVGDAVGALARKNPGIAERLVRSHAESVFDDAMRSNLSGPNEFGGAKFSSALIGNSEQAKSLEAAVRALPNGDVRWDGFRKFLDIAEATGQRQRIGSQTAFNKEFMDSLSKGGAIADAVPIIKSGGTALPGMIRERYAQYQLGKNTEQLARLITDPNALPVFRALAKSEGARAQAATLRLLAIAQQGKASLER